MYIFLYFGSHVVGRAAKSVCRPIQVDLQFTHAEIGDADVTLVVQKDVVQFQVSLYHNFVLFCFVFDSFVFRRFREMEKRYRQSTSRLVK